MHRIRAKSNKCRRAPGLPSSALELAGTVWKNRPMLVLASRSPTRKMLLSQAGIDFVVRHADIDERGLEAAAAEEGADASQIALRLAVAKARAVAGAGGVVIGGDQTLALGRELLHKPVDMAAARAQLLHLRGKTHRLHAAVALVAGTGILWSHIETAELTLREFSDAELDTADLCRRVAHHS